MKIIGAFCVLILVSFSGVKSETDSNELSDEIKKQFWDSVEPMKEVVDESVKEKCIKIGGKSAYVTYEKSREELINCITNIDWDKLEPLPSVLCKDVRTSIKQCFDKSSPGIFRCFKDDDKWFVRDFMVGNFNTLFEYVCTNMFDRLKELVSLDGLDCIATLIKNEMEFEKTTDLCLTNMLGSVDDYENLQFNKTEVCAGINGLGTCLPKAINEQCKTNHALLHLTEDVYELLKKPCK